MNVQDRMRRLENSLRTIKNDVDLADPPSALLDNLEAAMQACLEQVRARKLEREAVVNALAAADLVVGQQVRLTRTPIGWGRAHGELLAGLLKEVNRTDAAQGSLAAGYAVVEFEEFVDSKRRKFTREFPAAMLEPWDGRE